MPSGRAEARPCILAPSLDLRDGVANPVPFGAWQGRRVRGSGALAAMGPGEKGSDPFGPLAYPG
jgi:hypothetical protein